MTRLEFLNNFYCYEALGYFGNDLDKGLKIISKCTDKIIKSDIHVKVLIKDLLEKINSSDIKELHNRDWVIENEYLIYKNA